MDNEKQVSNKSLTRGRVFVVLVILLAAVFFLYRYRQYRESLFVSRTPGLITQYEVNDIVSKVGKLTKIPTNEAASIANVSAHPELVRQYSLKRSQAGDKIVIFFQSRKVIVFRPSKNMIVEYSSVPTSTPASSLVISKNRIKVAIYNGTTVNGYASTTERQLINLDENLDVILKTNAVNQYSKTKIIDLVGGQTGLMNQLKKTLNGEIVSLPAGEKKPEADILIILGK